MATDSKLLSDVLPDEVWWTSAEIVVWLASLGIGVGRALDVLVWEGPDYPDTPDELFVVTPIAGAGETLEGIGDMVGFQLLTRGPQLDPSGAQKMAYHADRAIRFSGFPCDVAGGALRLARVLRSGGAPALLGPADNAVRSILTCNYLTEILR